MDHNVADPVDDPVVHLPASPHSNFSDVILWIVIKFLLYY